MPTHVAAKLVFVDMSREMPKSPTAVVRGGASVKGGADADLARCGRIGIAGMEDAACMRRGERAKRVPAVALGGWWF